MAGNTTVSAWDNMANGAKAHLAQQRYIDEQRKAYNKYAKYWRKKDLDALKTERKEREAQIQRDFAGDKARLHEELNKLSVEFDRREADVKAKYPTWERNSAFDANAASGQKKYDASSGTYNDMTNLERAKSWAEHSAKIMEEDSDEGNRMREALSADAYADTAGEDTSADNTAGKGYVGRTDSMRRDNASLSNNAAHDVANTIYGQDPSGRSKQLREQARMHRVQAADEQKNSQQNFQVANRDARVEADKDDIAKAAVKNAQTVNNLSSGTGVGTAALNRTVEMGDIGEHRQRADQQRQEGVKNQREMWGARQTAEEEDGSANITDYKYRQARGQTAVSDVLSQEDDEDVEGAEGSDIGQEHGATDVDIGAQQLVNAALGFDSSEKGAPTAEEHAEMQRIRSKYPNITTPQHGYFQAKGIDSDGAEAAYYADPSFGPEDEKRAFMNELHNTRSNSEGTKYYDKETVSTDTADANYSVPVASIAGAIESVGIR